MVDAARDLDIEIRAGIHTGEIERRETGVGGIGVHIAARVLGAAEPGQVVVTKTVRDLATGTDLRSGRSASHEPARRARRVGAVRGANVGSLTTRVDGQRAFSCALGPTRLAVRRSSRMPSRWPSPARNLEGARRRHPMRLRRPLAPHRLSPAIR